MSALEILTVENLASGIVSGVISTVACASVDWLYRYYSRKARNTRKRLAACRKAICEMMERFDIETGHSNSYEWAPTLTPENYTLCLFETYLIINETTGRQRYPDDDVFKDAAKLWYSEWNDARMSEVVEFVSPAEMNYLLIEIHSWGEKGCPWENTYFPLVVKMINKFKQWRYARRSKSEKQCDFLYRDYKLPPSNHVTQIVLGMLEDDDKNE